MGIATSYHDIFIAGSVKFTVERGTHMTLWDICHSKQWIAEIGLPKEIGYIHDQHTE